MSRNLITLAATAASLAVTMARAETTQSTFALHPNPGVAACFEKVSGVAPNASVTVTKGHLHDRLVITVSGLKRGLDFDMFTVQRSNLDANGNPVTGFTNFGVAWYQSDLHANAQGLASTTINTILADQIFGFDPDVALAPTNTFHLGFWFNRPKDAAPCGFDVTKPTPFNGEHKAGPVAMISTPNPTTNLGPLCLNPNSGANPTCKP
jgi:hypothetical protein